MLNKHRPTTLCTLNHDVATHSNDLLEHVGEVACNGDFLHVMLDLAILDPVTKGTARVIARDVGHALPDEFRDKDARAHLAQHGHPVDVAEGESRAQLLT